MRISADSRTKLCTSTTLPMASPARSASVAAPRLHLPLGREGATRDVAGEQRRDQQQDHQHQGEPPVEEQGHGQQHQHGDQCRQVLPEHGQPQPEELVPALQHDLQQPAGVGAAMIGQVQLQHVFEELRADMVALAVGQPVGVQRHQDAGDDAPHPHRRPQTENLHAVPEGRLGPARGGLGEQVDGLAEQDGVQEGHGRQSQVGEGKAERQPAHGLEQAEHPAVDFQKTHLRHGGNAAVSNGMNHCLHL